MNASTQSEIDWEDAKRRIARVQKEIDENFSGEGKASKALLKARAKALARRGEAGRRQDPAVRFLIFYVAATRYAIDIKAVSAVGEWRAPGWVPGGGRELLGLFTMRGAVWAMFDLAPIIGVETGTSATGGKILFLRDTERRIALRVNDIEGIRAVAEKDIKPAPPGTQLPTGLAAGLIDKGIPIVDSLRLRVHPAFTEGSGP